MECKFCGHSNPENSNFCINCGENVSNQFNPQSTVVENDKSGISLFSMIAGIVSSVFGVVCCFGYISVFFALGGGILAIILAAVSWNSSKHSYSVAGLVCGIFGFVLGLLLLYINLNIDEIMEYYNEMLEKYRYSTIIKAVF